MYPKYFLSLTDSPSYLIDPTAARLEALSGMCIKMHVGELDSGSQSAMKQQWEQLRVQRL